MNEYAEEWMDPLRRISKECKDKEIEQQIKEQFIHGINNQTVTVKIIKDLRII